MVHDEVMAAVAGAPKAVAAEGAAATVEVAAAEEAAEASAALSVVARAAVADLLAAIGDATGGTTLERSEPR